MTAPDVPNKPTTNGDTHPRRYTWGVTATHTLLVVIVALGFTLRLVAISNANLERTVGRPLDDDSFYYFSLGRHIATGEGFRIDADHRTNGFQPLWGFMVVVPYLLFPNDLAHGIQAVQVLGALVGVATAFITYLLIFRISRSRIAGLVGVALWIFSPLAVRHNLNGMETSLAVLTYLAIFYALYNACENKTLRSVQLTGLACGIGFLARVDTLILILPIAGLLPFFASAENTWRGRSRVLLPFIGLALLPALPWILFTLAIGKPVIPESGQAVPTLATYLGDDPPPQPIGEVFRNDRQRFETYYGGWAANFARTIADQSFALSALELLPYDTKALNPGEKLTQQVYIALSLLMLSAVLALIDKAAALRVVVVVFTGWGVGMTGAYTLVVLGIWFFPRYSLPLAEVFSVLILAIIARFLMKVGVGQIWRRVISGTLILLFGLATLAVYQDSYQKNAHYQWILDKDAELPDDGFVRAMRWLEKNAEPSARIGAFQSGIVGYYAAQPLINLDGKVNTDAHHALAEGWMWRYVCLLELDYIVDWGFIIQDFLIERTPSYEWKSDNLTTVYEVENNWIAPVVIQKVNRINCPSD